MKYQSKTIVTIASIEILHTLLLGTLDPQGLTKSRSAVETRDRSFSGFEDLALKGGGVKLLVHSSKGRGFKGEGYLRQLGEPRGALGKTREYWGVLSYLPPLDPPPLRIP